MDRYPQAAEVQTMQETNAQIATLLAGWTVVDLDTQVALIDADFALSGALEVGDPHEASYVGYVRKTITVASWTHGQTEPSGSIRYAPNVLAAFQGPASGGSVTIYGWMLLSGDGPPSTRMYRVFKFATPVILPDDSVWLNIIPSATFYTGDMGQP